jgi:NADH-quinone oxidoreductase subunit E
MSVRRLYDEQPESFAFTPENLAWARETIRKYPEGKQASAVIPVLWRAQEQNDGWVTRPAMEYVAKLLDMSYIRVYEVATFYTMFQLAPVGRKAHVQVCGTTPCMLRGAEDLRKVCQRRIHAEPHHLSTDGDFSWEEVECLGACVNAPMVQIFKDTYEDLTPESFEKLLDDMAAGRKVKAGPQNGRQFSAPEGELTTLNEPGFYDSQRTYVRIEPPPPSPPPAAPPPSDAAKPKTAAPETAPAVKSPTEVKTGEASAALAKTQEKAISPPDRPTKADEKPELDVPKSSEPAKLVSSGEGKKPELLQAPRTGTSGDDLKLIWGVGPKLETILHEMGVWHFDQIAAWGPAELRWVDMRLGNFKGRATRDDWIDQAKKLATGWRPAKSTGDKPTG